MPCRRETITDYYGCGDATEGWDFPVNRALPWAAIVLLLVVLIPAGFLVVQAVLSPGAASCGGG